MAFTQYVFQDRANSDRWAISFEDGNLKYVATANTAQAEPIVQDQLNSADHWKFFVSDGQLAIEFTATVQDDSLIFIDSVTAGFVGLQVDDGQIRWIENFSSSSS